jgi:hypothetical protein
MNLVKIDPKEFGLEENKAKQISDMFKPMLDSMIALEKEYNEVVKLEISKEATTKAKELRLKYVKIRTGTAEIHKELKHFYLQGGRFVDGWKNAQLMSSQGIEEKLMAIERHYENIEAEKIEKLQEERALELEKYEVDFVPGNLGELTDGVWDNFLFGTKTSYDIRIAAEKKAEEDRVEAERVERLNSDRRSSVIHLWQFMPEDNKVSNFGQWDLDMWDELVHYLKKEKEDFDKEQERIRKENELLKKEAEAKAKKDEVDRKKREAEQSRLAKENEAKFKKERESREKIEAELKAKQESEQKAKEEEEARLQSELSKGDSAKVKDLISDLSTLKGKYSFKSTKNKKMCSDVGLLIDKVINHINL